MEEVEKKKKKKQEEEEAYYKRLEQEKIVIHQPKKYIADYEKKHNFQPKLSTLKDFHIEHEKFDNQLKSRKKNLKQPYQNHLNFMKHLKKKKKKCSRLF